MLSRQKRADIRNLSRKKVRIETGRFIAEGRRAVEQILANGRIRIEMILTDGEDFNAGPIPFHRLNKAEFSEFSDTETSQGVIAVCVTPPPAIVTSICAAPGMILAIDGLQDPGNLGTLVRTAAWFNAAGLFLGSGTTELYQPKVVRSTAGATGMLAAAEGELAVMLDEAASAGRPIFILDGGENAVPLESTRFPTNSVIVVGNEGRGVSPSILNLSYPKVRISGNASNVESLNAAVAASIAMHHVFTQNLS